MDGKGGVGAEQMRQGNGTLVVCPCGLLGAGSEAAAVWGPLPVVVAAGGPRGAVARVVALPVLLSCLYRPDSRGLPGRGRRCCVPVGVQWHTSPALGAWCCGSMKMVVVLPGWRGVIATHVEWGWGVCFGLWLVEQELQEEGFVLCWRIVDVL